MAELTEKQSKVLDTLKNELDGTGFAEDMVEKLDGMSIQAIRVVLSSLATKGYLSKAKDILDGKEKTRFTVK